MKKRAFTGTVIVCLLAGSVFGALDTIIFYQANEVGGGRWQYSYEVANIGLTSPIEEFTIWFDYGLYDNLAIETAGTLADNWDEIALQPEPVLEDDGAYDAKALGPGIETGHTAGPFVVSFDWLGAGEPGAQLYDIVDPATLETIESGTTIPEPATLLVLGLGGLALRKKGQRS